MPPVPHVRFSHIGINVCDMATMEDFYTRVVGLTVTDRGNALGLDLVFLSRDPRDHHQLVLGTGRPNDLPQNSINPMFGPVINQISFDVGSLDILKEMHAHLIQAYKAEYIYANHGTAWSIYVNDPEGNLIEFFVDSEWYCPQPIFEPLDLTLSNEEILTQTKLLAESSGKMRPMAEWRAEIAMKMGVTSPT